ncbi:MAG: hypothetical protein QOH63_2544 [Acidobacteriota bacterium]|jgi:hypothetical protein|nr:hypothetical protein [Acidobacteriota bacterium]
MLETLLHIGKILRDAGRMRHHRYIKPAPLSEPKSPVVYLSLPVKDDYEFDFENMSEITDENVQRNKLFYLTFKSSETDNAVKYLFGDILYGTDSKGKVLGYYKMKSEKAGFYGQSSFTRGQEDVKNFSGTIIEGFSKSFEKHLDEIESLLQEHGQGQQVFLHFDFSGKHWYEFKPELQLINQVLLGYFVEEQNGFCILRNFLYKTLIAGTSHTPGFSHNNAFKTKLFGSQDEIMDLIYAIDYSKSALISERDIKIVVLPKGDEITDKNIESFFERSSALENYGAAERNINEANRQVETSSLLDSLFEPVLTNVAGNITQFDFVFSQRGERGLDTDMLELSGVERSFLTELSERVKEIREPLREERDRLYPKRPKQFVFLDIRKAFLNILGDVTTDKKKYQSHLFKVLPQIYSGTYYRDAVLLPAFIEKTEYNIRNGTPDYNLLKYDYYFLVGLRNTNGDNAMDEMKHSKSYQAGLLLGKMAQPLDRKIASFEKNYVGLLSRRISDKQGLVKFANFVNEKLAIHDVAYPNLKQASVELAELVAGISDRDYRKNYCAFGFFEGYFGRNQDAAKPDTQAGVTEATVNN